MDVTHHAMRFTADYRVMLVDRASGAETMRLTEVADGGSIERNQDTETVESASLTYAGAADLANALLRIWADLTYEDGTTESIALGTFVTDGPKREITGSGVDSTPLNLYGRLRELADDQFAQPVSLAAGSDPLSWIEATIRDAGLEVAAHDVSTYRLGSTWTLGMDDQDSDSDGGDSKLTAINTLLDLMGWQSARTDPMGRVLLAPYVRPADRAPSWEFREGAGARFLRAMTDERDWFDTKNQIVVIYGNQDREVRGVAVDNDPDSPFSTVSRGRTVSQTTSYSDVPDDMSTTELQAMADSKAAELLATAQAVIRRITFTHIYAPVTLGDVVTLDYPSGGVQGDFSIRTQSISLTAGLPINCEARSFSR